MIEENRNELMEEITIINVAGYRGKTNCCITIGQQKGGKRFDCRVNPLMLRQEEKIHPICHWPILPQKLPFRWLVPSE